MTKLTPAQRDLLQAAADGTLWTSGRAGSRSRSTLGKPFRKDGHRVTASVYRRVRAAGLVRCEAGHDPLDRKVFLTDAGRAALDGSK